MRDIIVLCAVLSVVSAANLKTKRAADALDSSAFAALDKLRGRTGLGSEEQQDLINTARAGVDYPALATLPPTNFDCSSVNQPGYYADVSDVSRCQIYHRCDIEGKATPFLCSPMTVFNQITLTCGWYFDVNCTKAKAFYDFTNGRLYKPMDLMDAPEPDYVPVFHTADADVSTTANISDSSSEPVSDEGLHIWAE